MPALLDHALDAADRGYRVIPLEPPVPGVKRSGKAPLLGTGWQHRVTRDEAVIRSWWDRWPEANVGARPPAQIVVLDVDGDEGARHLDHLQELHGQLPETRTTRTGSGGLHLHYGYDGRPLVGKLGSSIDLRHGAGDVGSQIVMPGSRHYSGGEYSWLRDRRAVHLPAAWLELVTAPVAAVDAELPEGAAKLSPGLPARLRATVAGSERSNAFFGTLTACRNAGMDYNDVRALVVPAFPGLWDHLVKDGVRDLDRRWTYEVERHRQRFAEVPALKSRAEAVEALHTYALQVRAAGWPGIGGETDRGVLDAIVTRATLLSTLTLTFATRELAELTGVSRRTVTTSLTRLVTAGWLLCAHTKPGAPDRFTLRRAERVSNLPQSLALTRETDWRKFDTHDAWQATGLGSKARALTEFIEAHAGLTSTELVAALDGEMSRKTVFRALKKLSTDGVRVLVEDGGWRVADDLAAALDEAALTYGVTGRLESRKRQHRDERAFYASQQERKRWSQQHQVTEVGLVDTTTGEVR